jgi:hypothetical protein
LIYLFIDSALVLPRVGKNARIEHGIYVCAIDVCFLEILSILVFEQMLSFKEHFFPVEILVSRLGEATGLRDGVGRRQAHAVCQQLTIELVSFFPAHSEIVANEVGGHSLGIGKTARFIIVLLLLSSHYLWPGAELELVVLREILYHALILVQISQILVLIRVRVIVE